MSTSDDRLEDAEGVFAELDRADATLRARLSRLGRLPPEPWEPEELSSTMPCFDDEDVELGVSPRLA